MIDDQASWQQSLDSHYNTFVRHLEKLFLTNIFHLTFSRMSFLRKLPMNSPSKCGRITLQNPCWNRASTHRKNPKLFIKEIVKPPRTWDRYLGTLWVKVGNIHIPLTQFHCIGKVGDKTWHVLLELNEVVQTLENSHQAAQVKEKLNITQQVEFSLDQIVHLLVSVCLQHQRTELYQNTSNKVHWQNLVGLMSLQPCNHLFPQCCQVLQLLDLLQWIVKNMKNVITMWHCAQSLQQWAWRSMLTQPYLFCGSCSTCHL